MSWFTRIYTRVLALPKLYLFGGALAVVVVGLIGANILSRTKALPAASEQTPHVTVSSVASLASQLAPLEITGVVTSQSQATILAQTSGSVTGLFRQLGDYVGAGGIIAQFENASQKAAVTQAQGLYDAAQATVVRVTGSSTSNTTQSSQTALQSAHVALDDAIHTRADQLFNNPRTNPVLVITVPDQRLVNKIQNERPSIETVLVDAEQLAAPSAGDVTEKTHRMTSDINAVLDYLDDLTNAVNETTASELLPASTLAGYQTLLAAARTELVSALTNLTSAKSAFDANDVKAANATLTQAEGSLAAAQAALEKTIVRAPVSGTIVSLSITKGDYVSQNTQIAVVSNPGALYIDAQITPEDAKTLSVGGKALISGSTAGVITFIAPALDPLTGKIKLKVGVSTPGALTDGSVVTLSLARAERSSPKFSALTIPIVAIKMFSDGPAVFTTTASSTLSVHPVKLGSIVGDRIVVASGLSASDQIVTDARGLSEGESVIVDTL